MIADGKAPPRQGNTKKALALAADLEADEDAKQAQRDKDAKAAAATAEKALTAKRTRRAARHAAASQVAKPGRKVR